MSNYGLTEKGFIRKRLPEIITSIFERIDTKSKEHYNAAVSRSANSVTGILVSIFAAEIDEQWLIAENTYNAMYPSSANGVQLDNAVSFAGMKRITAEKSYFFAVCTGSQNTLLPRHTQIRGSDNEKYSLKAQSIISTNNCVGIFILPSVMTPGTIYTLAFDGTNISTISEDGDTSIMILNKIIAKIPANWTGELVGQLLHIKKSDRQYGSTVIASTTLNVVRVSSSIKFTAENFGALDPPLKSVDKIVTQVLGFESVLNETATYIGRNNETDTEVRQYHSRRVHVTGKSMVENIAASIHENVEGVKSVLVYENTSDETDSENRPPHSIEAIVQGGDAISIAKEIFSKKACGIDTFGSQMQPVTDSQGVKHNIYFNRPQEKLIWVKISLTKNTEEDLPGDTAAKVADIVLTNGNALLVGSDVILQKFFGFIYKGTAGIGMIDMQLSTDGINYYTQNIVVGVRELAVFDLSRISVVIEL